MFLVLDLLQRKVYIQYVLTLATQPGGWWPIPPPPPKKKKKMCKTSCVKKWEVFYCMPMEVKEDAQEQSVTVAGLPGWRFYANFLKFGIF